MSDFEKLKEQLPSKEKCYSSLTGKKIVEKNINIFFSFLNKFEMKTMKDYYDLYLKHDVLLLAYVWKNLEITA